MRHPDFIVFHPARMPDPRVRTGRSTIRSADRRALPLVTARGEVASRTCSNRRGSMPRRRAGFAARPAARFSSGSGRSKAPLSVELWRRFPQPHARQFEEGGLGEVIPSAGDLPDEMLENVRTRAFQRLWAMFSVRFESPLSRRRSTACAEPLFPGCAFHGDAGRALARRRRLDLVQVMDLQQEQLARAWARTSSTRRGSGKTLILYYRAGIWRVSSTSPFWCCATTGAERAPAEQGRWRRAGRGDCRFHRFHH